MAIGMPFSPTTGATVGNTVKVTANATPTSVAGSVNCKGDTAAHANANAIRVYNSGTVLAFVRVSAEATPAATAADIPLAAGATLLIMNPNPQGITGVAALSSTTTACDVYFTPGEGGI